MTSLGEESNPYAAPQAELQLPSVESRPAAFYPMSARKAVVMSVLTFNLFDLVFWYRHWTRLKESGHDVSPIFRTIFAGFTSFGFVTTLSTARAARGLESGLGLRASPGIYLGLNVSARLSEKVLEGVPDLLFSMLACAGCASVLATIQRGANEVLAADEYRGPSNSGITGGAIVAGVVGLLLWLAVIAGAVSPETFELE